MARGNTVSSQWGTGMGETIGERESGELTDASVVRGAPAVAIKVQALLSGMVRFGIRRALIESNPVSGLESPAPKLARDPSRPYYAGHADRLRKQGS